MSGAPTTKAVVSDSKDGAKALDTPKAKPTQLEEDDEFEDFPVEDWPDDQDLASQTASTANGGAAQTGGAGTQSTSHHLWEESWDDDDTSDDFAKQLKAELEKGRK